MAAFPPALAHGTFVEVFPNVFTLEGRFSFMPGMSITRNMTVIRQGDELTLVNSVRLGDDGEKELEKLGRVKHVIRIGAFHGADDPYYVDRYKPKLWAPPGTTKKSITYEHQLVPGSSPIEGAKVFAFETAKLPEAIIVLEREGGILITCDSYQNWTTYDGCSALAKVALVAGGFGPTIIGGPWVMRQGRTVRKDFDRLLEFEFKHLIPGHGTLLRDEARAGLKTAIAKRFGG